MTLLASKRPHFIGIGGVGMCALAEILVHDGYAVSGCDTVASERTRRLAELGVAISIGHHRDHIDDADLVVISAAIADDHAELAAARERGIPIVRRSRALGEMMHGRTGVAVAGTHGKTTTTAMVGQLLDICGFAPSVIAGGRMNWVGAHAVVGDSDIVVCEADEFDRAFLDLDPDVAIVTNIEPEHLECYGSVDHLHRAFARFASSVGPAGAVVLCSDDEGARRLERDLGNGFDGRLIRYGLGEEADLRAVDVVEHGSGTSCRIVEGPNDLGPLRLHVPGRHNLRNALAAIAAARQLGVEFEVAAAACARFDGVARRFEVLGERGGVTVVDDYAHHPTEVEAALASARQFFTGRRLVAVFQPHLYSRTRDHAEAFAEVLGTADVVVVLPIYPAREQPIAGVTADLIIERLPGTVVVRKVREDRLEAFDLNAVAETGDVVMTLGAGDVHRFGEAFVGGGA